MKIYEIALKKLGELKKENKKRNIYKNIYISILITVLVVLIFNHTLLRVIGFSDEYIKTSGNKIILIYIITILTIFAFLFIRNIIKLEKYKKINKFYFKYTEKEIDNFVKLNENNFNDEYVKNQIRRCITENNDETIDNIFYLCKTENFRNQFFWLRELTKFNNEFNKDIKYEIENNKDIIQS